MKAPREWTRRSLGVPESCLPLRLRRSGMSLCGATHPDPDYGVLCTRIAEHTGRHAAGGDAHILAVWEVA